MSGDGTGALRDLVASGRRIGRHRPFPRVAVAAPAWAAATRNLAEGRLTLQGLWGDGGHVHMALLDEGDGEFAVLSLAASGGRFPSVGAAHPPAIRLERTVRDLFGLEPDEAPDPRPWLDHGRWGLRHPLGRAGGDERPAAPYAFLPAEGESLHQVPVGPVHAGIIEPGHFRFTASGETVVRLEERLGYVHKGVEALMTGADLRKAAALAGRVSGDSTVACGIAFARAAEAACGVEPPLRAHFLRALMAELERIANHLGDIGAICNDATFTLMHARCGILRERVLRTAEACFGQRLMMDRVVPGGVATDLAPGGAERVRMLLAEIRREFPRLVELYDNTASLQDRTVGAGILSAGLARQFGAGGYVGRASGRAFDARRAFPYPPYDRLRFEIPVETAGDVDARVRVRVLEVEQSLSLIEQIIGNLPPGAFANALCGPGAEGGEAAALVEGFRGDILVWLRLDADGRVARCHVRDPSWFQWPLLEAAIEGNIVADFPLCNKSFNCSYSGHDL